jgi:hypothetical protein
MAGPERMTTEEVVRNVLRDAALRAKRILPRLRERREAAEHSRGQRQKPCRDRASERAGQGLTARRSTDPRRNGSRTRIAGCA